MKHSAAFTSAIESLSEMTAVERHALARAIAELDNHEGAQASLPTIVQSVNGLDFYSDGSIGAQAFEDYFATVPKQPSPIQHSGFFSDNEAAWKAAGVPLTKEALDNIRQNVAVQGTPLFNGAAYAGFIDSDDKLVSKKMTGLPYAFSSRRSVAEIPQMVAEWKASNFVPTQLYSNWGKVI